MPLLTLTAFHRLTCVFGLVTRLIPHFPNATGFFSALIFLAEGQSLKRQFCYVIFMAVIADILLMLIKGWNFTLGFCFSNYLIFVILILFSRLARGRLFYSRVMATVVSFWIMSNAWVWLQGIYYPLNSQGFIACYTAALPFLRNALLWEMVITTVLVFHWRKLSYNHAKQIRASDDRIKSAFSTIG